MEIIKNHMKYNNGVVFIRGGFLSGRDYVRGGFCPSGFCPGGFLSVYLLNTMEIIQNHMKYNDRVVFVRGGFCPGGIMSGGFFDRVVFVRGGFCPYTDLCVHMFYVNWIIVHLYFL